MRKLFRVYQIYLPVPSLQETPILTIRASHKFAARRIVQFPGESRALRKPKNLTGGGESTRGGARAPLDWFRAGRSRPGPATGLSIYKTDYNLLSFYKQTRLVAALGFKPLGRESRAFRPDLCHSAALASSSMGERSGPGSHAFPARAFSASATASAFGALPAALMADFAQPASCITSAICALDKRDRKAAFASQCLTMSSFRAAAS